MRRACAPNVLACGFSWAAKVRARERIHNIVIMFHHMQNCTHTRRSIIIIIIVVAGIAAIVTIVSLTELFGNIL